MDIKKSILEDLGQVKRALLLLLSANSNMPIHGKLWYQKELFMLAKNNEDLEEEAQFEAYFWGPHSDLADSEIEELVQLGVVKQTGCSYALTEMGQEIAMEVSEGSSKSERDLVSEVKEFFHILSKDELLLFIYVSYPEMVEDAVEFKNCSQKVKKLQSQYIKKGRLASEKLRRLQEYLSGR